MVESSLSNWDGSQSPKKTKPPVPSQSTSSNSLVAIARPHPATASSSSAKDVDLEQQNRVEVSQKSTQSNADEKQKQTSLYPTSKLAPSSVMAMGAATLPAPQKSPLLPSLPLHFDAPSLALGPALHPSSPSATAPFGPPRAPSELNYSIGFGAPGPALRVPSTSLSSLSALSIPALDSISSKPPTPKSTSSSSASSRKLPQTSASAQRHPSRSSTSASVPVSSSSKPPPTATRPGQGSWWVDGLKEDPTKGRDAAPSIMTQKFPTETSTSAAQRRSSAGSQLPPHSKTFQEKEETETVREKEGKQNKSEKGKELVTYLSRSKAGSAASGSVYGGRSVNGKSASRGSSISRSVGRKETEQQQLFMPSPEHPSLSVTSSLPPSPARDVAHLFTPPPDELFTPPPEGPQKRKREVMDYVVVPRARYALKRARTNDSYSVRGESMRTGRGESRGLQRRSASRGYSARTGSAALAPRQRNSEYDDDDDDDDDSDSDSDSDSEGESRSRSRTRTDQPKKLKTYEVHMSVGDALNNAWARNEAAGTLPVGLVKGAVRGKRKERERDSDRESKVEKRAEVEGARKRARTGGRETMEREARIPMSTDDRAQPEKRVRKPPRRPDDVSVAPARAPIPVQRGAWCEEEGDVTRLRFDVLVEEADRLASAALLHTGIPGIAAWAAIGANLEIGARVPWSGAPCPVWPLPRGSGADANISAGGLVRGSDDDVEDGREEKAKGGRKARLEVPRGRSTQRASQQPSEKEVSHAQQQHQKQGPSTLPETQIFRTEQSQLRLDLSKPNPKLKVKPHALRTPSKSAPSMFSQSLTPTTSFHSPLPLSSPTTATSAPPPPTPTLFSPSSAALSFGPVGLPLMMAEDVTMPMPLSAKARGKQKAPTEGEERTPSPAHVDTWNQRSGSRGPRSASRGRRSTSRRPSASYGHSGSALHSPIEMSDILHEFGPSPTRPGLEISSHALQYYPIIPPIPSSVSDPFMHSPIAQQPAQGFYPALDNQPYGDGTIDPSLLLGGGMMGPDVEDSYEPGVEDSYERDEEDARMASPSPSAASSSSSAQPSVSATALRVSGRRRIERHVPDDMIRTDLLESDDSSSAGSLSSFTDSRSPSPKPKSKPAPQPKPTAVKRRKVKEVKGGEPKVNDPVIPAVYSSEPFFRYSGPPWPPGDPDLFCHQCRRKTRRLSMQFDDCSHVYCVGCIMMKYPADTIAFERITPNDNCPRCNDTCSCDNCTSRRGEAYLYGRTVKVRSEQEPLTPRIPRTTVMARVQNNPYNVMSQMVIEPTAYYATMYDLTGARVAHVFLGADGNSDYAVAQPVQGRRVFVGAVQEGWNLGRDPIVFVDPPSLGKRKRGLGSGRFYVGDQSVLSLPLRPRPRQPSPSPPPLPPLPPAVSVVDAVLVTPPTTPPPAPDMHAFSSPLTDLAESETSGEDGAQGESKMADEDDAHGESESIGMSEMVVEPDAQGESETAGEAETQGEPGTAGTVTEPYVQGELETPDAGTEMIIEPGTQGESDTAGEAGAHSEPGTAGTVLEPNVQGEPNTGTAEMEMIIEPAQGESATAGEAEAQGEPGTVGTVVEPNVQGEPDAATVGMAKMNVEPGTQGESETAEEADTQDEAGTAGDGQGESGYELFLNEADAAAAQKPPRTDGQVHNVGLADASALTDGSGIKLTNNEIAKAISSALNYLGISTVMAIEPL